MPSLRQQRCKDHFIKNILISDRYGLLLTELLQRWKFLTQDEEISMVRLMIEYVDVDYNGLLVYCTNLEEFTLKVQVRANSKAT